MKNKTGLKFLLIVILIICLGVVCYWLFESSNNTKTSETFNDNNSLNDLAQNGLGEPPSKGQGGPGENSSSETVDANGKTTISDSQNLKNVSYESTEDSQNALLVEDEGDVTLTNASITKTGDSSDEKSDFYGTNAGVLVNSNGKLEISDSKITTNGSHANGLFVYGTGEATISDTTITTSKNNSGGIMVAGGGSLTANNLTIETDGGSSAAIRSDRGGGTMTVTGGTYTTNGTGSPVIYSTADVTVNDATMLSTSSEGAVVEGANSIILNNCTLTDTNTTLNGNSETYKNIFLYQSMSGDANEGTAEFTAKNSKITTNKGDTIFVTNTKATINLENNTILNKDGDFLRIQTGKWGKSGSNGGDVTLNLINQEVQGNIIVDSISTLEMNVKSGSSYTGAINSDNTAKQIDLILDSTSKLILTGDTYVTSLEDSDLNYSNIDFNGYTLYENGTAIN